MTLPTNYFDYPYRRPGMDHDRYAYSNLFKRKPVIWPGGARIALWIVPTLEFFPLDMAPKGVKPAGRSGATLSRLLELHATRLRQSGGLCAHCFELSKAAA